MYCAALPEQGLGVALKMDDGNNARAAEVVMAELLLRLLSPGPTADAHLLQSLSRVPLVNWQGIGVGELRSAF